MNQKKIGSIFIISTLALAGIGISYAGFTDEINIFGTVNTGTVDLELIEWYSGTWVFKIWDIQELWTVPDFPYTTLDVGNEILIFSGWSNIAPTEDQVKAWANINGGEAELVSFSEAKTGSTHDDVAYDVDFVYENLFPCIDFTADFIVHYSGSIPAKIDVAEIFSEDGWLQNLWVMYKDDPNAGFGAYVEAYRCYPVYSIDDPNLIVGWSIDYEDPVDVGYQLHYCNYVYVKLVIHLPQDNIYQGLSGTFTGKVGVIQWNDQCEEPGPQTGTITIIKQTSPSGGTGFTFTDNIEPPYTFTLDDQQSKTFTNVPIGTYIITESDPSPYYSLIQLASTADLGIDTDLDLTTRSITIHLDVGGNVECSFLNEEQQLGTIIVEKQTIPDGATESFTFTGDAAGTIADGGQIVVSNLPPGIYTSTEIVPPGWQLVSIVCDDANSLGDINTQSVTFNLELGETVKCTFTNEEILT